MSDRPVPSTEGLLGKSRFVQANGLRHHLLEYGPKDATPVLILPGIPSPAPTWEFVARELADDYRVFTADIRGRGLSDNPPSGYTLPDYAADAAGVIEALGLDRPIVLGHSMGARIATALGALHPDSAGALVIVDPPLTGPGRGVGGTGGPRHPRGGRPRGRGRWRRGGLSPPTGTVRNSHV